MPLLILGKDVANYMKLDPSLSAIKGSPRPMESNKSWISLGLKTTTGLAGAIAAAAPIFSLQNFGPNLLTIRRVQVCYTVTTAYPTPQYIDLGLIVSRGITVQTTGGTQITLGLSNNGKLMTEGGSLSAANCRMATTAALTAGTRTLDTNYLGQAGAYSAVIGTNLPLTTLFDQGPGEYPLVLATGEGIEIAPVTALGATGVLQVGVNVEVNEIPLSTFF